MKTPVYVLGTGLSHDGSACLLKDGVIQVAIEKERISRLKHDGGNDSLAVEYCLEAAGITISDLSLVVQCANFEKDEIRPERYKGARPFNSSVPIVTISHHLAHAWSAVGTCPFDQSNVLVIDGCGSFYHQCDDLKGAFIPPHVNSEPGLFGEKDSFYFFDGKTLTPLYKDFSIVQFRHLPGQVYLPTSSHSIGGLYSMASQYCFGDFDDAGKLMGLAPYGRSGLFQEQLLLVKEGHIWVDEAVMHRYFTQPADPVTRPFQEHFQYYADIARWIQDETERALLSVFHHRHQFHPFPKLCYAGGVALNAVANSKLFHQTGFEQFYIEPAAGDNGLALGCAFYGWISHLQQERIMHQPGHTCFGKNYGNERVQQALGSYTGSLEYAESSQVEADTAALLLAGKTVGWFQLGCEFGPRALGRRSILADPRNKSIQHHINSTIKFREDFRPFAPAVLIEDKDLYFQYGFNSPFMIMVDQIREEWKEQMPGVVHVDGSCRVQTVSDRKEPFYRLLQEWKKLSGISVLLNTSFNKKGMPIVETPEEAISFFLACSLDVLVIGNRIITKS